MCVYKLDKVSRQEISTCLRTLDTEQKYVDIISNVCRQEINTCLRT